MTEVTAPIVSVTVYTNRARVTRRGMAHLPAGVQTLVIAGVPATIDPDSLTQRAEREEYPEVGTGPGGAIEAGGDFHVPVGVPA